MNDAGVKCGYMPQYGLTRLGISALFLSFENCYRVYDTAKKILNKH